MVAKKTFTKRKKKAWYGLYAPEIFNNAFLGETHVYNPEDVVGKTISMNVSMFTNDMKKQNVIISFRTKEIKDNKGITEIIGYSLSQAYLKRLVRRKRDKVDDSFLAKSKDEKIVRIKTVAMTNFKTSESAISAVRLSLRAKIRKALKEITFDEFVNALINIRLQKDWKKSLNKIYPLKFLEVRFVGLENVKKAIKEEDKDLTEKEAEEDIDDKEQEELEKEAEEQKEDVEDIEELEIEKKPEDDEEESEIKNKK